MLKFLWEKIWNKANGKKLWSAICIAIGYGLSYARSKYPYLPWDEVIIPILVSLGLIGAGHKVIKSRSKLKMKRGAL